MTTFYNTKNRIDIAIKKTKERLVKLSDDKIANLEKTATADDDMMMIMFQQQQAKASAMGKINYDEGLTLYNLFGGEIPTKSKYNKKPLADRIVGLQVITELMR